jgi:hypothetical protein
VEWTWRSPSMASGTYQVGRGVNNEWPRSKHGVAVVYTFSGLDNFRISPYLWSFSNNYIKGKDITDGSWSDSAISNQCGAAILFKRLYFHELYPHTNDKQRNNYFNNYK